MRPVSFVPLSQPSTFLGIIPVPSSTPSSEKPPAPPLTISKKDVEDAAAVTAGAGIVYAAAALTVSKTVGTAAVAAAVA